MSTVGMHAGTGALIAEEAHIAQSIRRILTTPVGSRVMRRDFGSLVSRFVDAPGNDATRLRLQAAAVTAITRWEPRVDVRRVDIEVAADGVAVITIEAQRRTGPATDAPLAVAVRLSAP